MSSNLTLLGKRIRALRKAKGLTQEELAVAAESGSKYISEVERGEANLTVTLADKIAKALEVETSVLFENDHEASRKELETAIHDLLAEADDAAVKTIYRVVKSVVR